MYNSQTYVKKKALPDEVSDVPSDQATESTSMNNRIVINNTANFRKTFNYHHFTGIVGQSYEKSKEHRTSVAGNSFFSPDLVGLGAAQSKRVTYSGEQAWALFSAFARINYQYKHKYMGGVTYRIDGHSKYNNEHRYLNTPHRKRVV